MNLVNDVWAELFGMFVADLRMTLAILAVVALCAGLVWFTSLPDLVAGGVLLGGSIMILILAVLRRARV